jgi:hypothetical protein
VDEQVATSDPRGGNAGTGRSGLLLHEAGQSLLLMALTAALLTFYVGMGLLAVWLLG